MDQISYLEPVNQEWKSIKCIEHCIAQVYDKIKLFTRFKLDGIENDKRIDWFNAYLDDIDI